MKKLLKLNALVLSLVLAGCAAGEHTRAISKVFGDDGTAPELMTNQHIVGVVSFDEKYIDDAHGIARTALYASGIRKEANNLGFRYVAVSSPRLEYGSVLLQEKSGTAYITGAVVPDQIGALKRWDIVELRSIAPWDTLVDFRATQEGQIVTRVLCRKSDPKWKECADAQPKFGKRDFAGQTGRPFPASTKGYPESFTFSEFYDSDGKLLRPLP